MLTAAVVILVPPREYKLSRKSDTHNPSDISNGLRFRGVDRQFLALSCRNCQQRDYLTVREKRSNDIALCEPLHRMRGPVLRHRGLIRVKFKFFSFLGNTRRTRRQPCTSKSTTSESGRSRSSRLPRTCCASSRARKGPRS